MPEARPAAAFSLAEVEARVLDVVRQLATETGGERASRAASVRASFERDLGLGSLERVELLVRLEHAFGRKLEDRHLEIDSASEMARAIASPEETAAVPETGARAETLAPATDAAFGARTLHESLFRRAQAEPQRPAVYLREDDGRETPLTYGALWQEAALLAGGLRARGVTKGDTVALMLPTGRDFLFAFQGILIAGAVPVPIYPPVRLDRLEEYARRQSAILADAGVKILVTVLAARPVASLLRPAVATLRHVVTPDELREGASAATSAEGDSSDPAFVQYTSGSTGSPKGVLLTHANLLANIEAITAGLRAQPDDVGASWLPLYHDMGLIGSWLFCSHRGIPLALQSPLSFLARPERWLWAIHNHRATMSAAPNFAYELCVRKIPDAAIQGLDLSSWRCALNGAEPVSPDTIDRFVARFSAYGFRREAMMPVYGLAENSVALCFPPTGRGPKWDRVDRRAFEAEGVAQPSTDAGARVQPTVGVSLPAHEVRIVDGDGRELPDRRVGRLVFRGPSMTAGYFKKPDATAAMTAPGGFLDSGDLAYRAEGEYYIAGRKKDLIIKGGRNLAPQEIEEAAGEVPGVRRGCVAAFGVESGELGTERLVIAAESRAKDVEARDKVVAEVMARVAEAVGMPPDEVVLIPPGTIPKTSSGKIRRSSARESYLSGRLGRPEGTSLGQKARLVLALAGDKAAAWARSLPGLLFAAWIVLLGLVVVAPLWLVVFFSRSPRVALACGRWSVRLLLKGAFCRLTVEGLDRLPAKGPYLLVANHASYVDVPALMALLPVDFLFVSKVEALGYPIIGTYLRRCRHLTVDRFDVQQSLVGASDVARAMEEGHFVLLFPEGTFTADDGLRPFRMGAFKTAVDTGAPVVPMALRGTRRVLRGETLFPWPGPIHLWVGEPILPDGSDWRAMVSLRDRVAEAIAAHCGEPRLDLVAGGPERPPSPGE